MTLIAKDEMSPVRPELSAAQRALIEQRLQRVRLGGAHATAVRPSIPRRAEQGELPLSFAQERLWFLDQLEPGTAVYNLCQGVRMRGALDIATIEKALNEVVRRHESLRTNFVGAQGRPVQVIAPVRDLPLIVVDLTDRAEEFLAEAELQRLLGEESRRPFDLASDMLLRAVLICRSATDHTLALTMHHIISDGWSIGILFQELSVLYSAFRDGRPSPLPELPVQFGDFVLWERKNLQGPALAKSLTFWKKQLGGTLPVLDLPFDHTPTATLESRGAVHAVTFPRALTDGLKGLSQQQGTTLFMTLLAAFQVLLQRWTGQDDIPVGSVVAGRRKVELEKLIGFFVSTLVFRGDLTGAPTFRALLGRVTGMALDALAHDEMPFEHLVKELRPDRTLSRNPLFQVMFLLQNAPVSDADWPGLKLEPLELDTGTAKFDLTLAMMETPEGLRTALEYNAALFEPGTIARLLGSFEALLHGIVANPDESIATLPLLTAPEQHKILFDWNDTALGYERDACIHQLFEAQARQTPEACAIVGAHERLTYAELDRRAEVLATRLRALGVGGETLVGLFLERTPLLLVGMLGILKAGGAYVPLDRAYPAERLTFIVEDTRMSVLVTEHALAAQRPAGAMNVVMIDDGAQAPPAASLSEAGGTPAVLPTALAYVIYTSGTTGRPKGVQVTQRGVVALAAWARKLYSAEELAGVLFSTSACFDVSVFESLVPLMLGGKIILADNILQVGALAAAGEVTLMSGVPSAMAEVVRAGIMPLSVRTVNVAGEPCSQALVESLYAQGQVERVYDVYGPTETTVYSTGSLRTRGGPATIGRPLANEQAHILDSRLQPVPIGVRGELFIGGDKVARGYLNRPELTAEKFLTVPLLPGRRLYRTGDAARYHADGTIEYLGRLDRQVKIRGHRVEPAEIEAVLAQHPAVRECAVVVRADALGGKRLAAYIVSAQKAAPAAAGWRDFLGAKLPEYLVPSSFTLLDALPLAPNGKLDVSALPTGDAGTAALTDRYIEARDDTEKRLVEIWERVLGVRPIGVHHRFFDLGGHSLLAVRLAAEIEQGFGKKLRVAAIFQHRTIEQLALLLRDETPRHATVTSIVEIKGRGARLPLYLVHGVGGGMFWGYANLARHLGPDQPLYAFKSRGLEGQAEWPTIEAMAENYIADLRAQQPAGPYQLGGYCFGGVVAFEMARQLQAQGESVSLLALINCSSPNSSYGTAPARGTWGWKLRFSYNLGQWLKSFLFSWSMKERVDFVRWKYRLLWKKTVPAVAQNADTLVTADVEEMANVAAYSAEQRRLWQTHVRALKDFQPRIYAGRLALFRTHGHPLLCSFDEHYGWGDFVRGGIDVHIITGGHGSILTEPHVQVVATALTQCMREPEKPASLTPFYS